MPGRLVALICLCGYSLAAGQVNLTPRAETIEDEDGEQNIAVTRFSDGDRTIFVDFGERLKLYPQGKSRLTLVPAGGGDAEISIDVAAAGFPTSETGLKEFVVKQIPKDAELTKAPAELQKWMSFASSDTWYLDLEYQMASTTYARRTIFWTFADRQFRFTITCSPAMLNKSFQLLKAPMLSWHWDDQSHLRPLAITMEEDQEVEAGTAEVSATRPANQAGN